jgi:hypothetical protein
MSRRTRPRSETAYPAACAHARTSAGDGPSPPDVVRRRFRGAFPTDAMSGPGASASVSSDAAASCPAASDPRVTVACWSRNDQAYRSRESTTISSSAAPKARADGTATEGRACLLVRAVCQKITCRPPRTRA